MRYENRVHVNCSTTGTGGPLDLGTAVVKYRTFADAGYQDGDEVEYVIEDGDDWELCTGVIGGTVSTVTRVTSESSNSNDPLDLSGSARIFVQPHATFFNAEIDDGLITGAVTRTEDYGSIA